MDKKIATYSLGIFIAALLVFIGSYAWYMQVTQNACNVDINSAHCVQKFPAFVKEKIGR